MADRRDPSADLWLAFVIGAAAAFFLVLPPPLKTAAWIGALVGAAAGALFGLIRRYSSDPDKRKGWLSAVLAIPPFAVGASFGFVLMTWLAANLPGWLSAIMNR